MAFNLPLFRTVAFGASLLFAVILLGLNAHILSTRVVAGRTTFYFDFAALAVASGVLTIASLPAMYIIDMKRKGAFTSWVAVEYGVTTLLWILWLATAARAADYWTVTFALNGGCSGYIGTLMTLCGEFATTMALGFVTWILLMSYSITLLTFAILSQNRGNKGVWTGATRDISLAPVAKSEQGASPMMTSQPPVQQYATPTGTPAAYPPSQPQYQQPYQQQPPQGAYYGTASMPGLPMLVWAFLNCSYFHSVAHHLMQGLHHFLPETTASHTGFPT